MKAGVVLSLVLKGICGRFSTTRRKAELRDNAAAFNPGGYGSEIYTDLSKTPPPAPAPQPGQRRPKTETDWPPASTSTARLPASSANDIVKLIV
jgi:hypothetical protein